MRMGSLGFYRLQHLIHYFFRLLKLLTEGTSNYVTLMESYNGQGREAGWLAVFYADSSGGLSTTL